MSAGRHRAYTIRSPARMMVCLMPKNAARYQCVATTNLIKTKMEQEEEKKNGILGSLSYVEISIKIEPSSL